MMLIDKRKIGFSIFLSIITCNFYAIYWQYLLVRNVKVVKKDDSGCMKEMLCLVFVPFYCVYWWFTRGETVHDEFSKFGYPVKSNKVLFLILSLFGLGVVAMAIMQYDFNSSTAYSNISPAQHGVRKLQIKCPHCGGLNERDATNLESNSYYGCPFVKCVHCGETYFDEKITEMAIYKYKGKEYSVFNGIICFIFGAIFAAGGIATFIFAGIAGIAGLPVIGIGGFYIWGGIKNFKGVKNEETRLKAVQQEMDASTERCKDSEYMKELLANDENTRLLFALRQKIAEEKQE